MNEKLNTLQFRPAVVSDAAEISVLVARFCHEFFIHPNGDGAQDFLDAVSEQSQRNYLEDRRYRYLLAVKDEQLVGFIAMRDVSHIFHLFVHPDFQGFGLATELWQRSKKRAEVQNYSGPYTVNSSVNAIPVYERFGFSRSEKLMEKDGISFLPMQLVQP